LSKRLQLLGFKLMQFSPLTNCWVKSDRPVIIYFLRAHDGSIKIGYTAKQKLAQRIKQLQTGNPFPLQLLAIKLAKLEEEKAIHSRFSHLRVSGEWFKPDSELLEFIKQFISK